MRVEASLRRCTTLLAICLAVGMICGPTAAQGPLVSEVRVEGAGYVSADIVLDSVKDILKPGVELTRELLAEVERAVMKLGYYLRVTVSQRQTPQGVQVIINVVEKPRIERIVFVGNTAFSEESLLKRIKSRVGGMADNARARADARLIMEAYESAGYIAQVARADIDNFGVLTFVIIEARIEDVKIGPLKRTKEWVVRRQINLKKGELFQEQRIKENVHRILDLGIFEKVTPTTRRGKDDDANVIVEFNITEARTGQAGLTLAYSSLDKLVLMLSVQESNFRGQAEQAAVNFEVFGRTSFDLTYTDPFLDAGGTSLEASVFDTERRRGFGAALGIPTSDNRYQERRSGASLRLSRPLDPSDRRRFSVRLRTEKVSIPYLQAERQVFPQAGDVHTSAIERGDRDTSAPGPITNPELRPDMAEPGDIVGPIIVSAPLHPGGRLNSITLGITNDMRDSKLRTTRGHFTSLSTEVAGSFVGGDTDFRKVIAEHRRYYPVRTGKAGPDVVAIRLMGGTTFGDVPLFEAFSAGGTNSIRGYDEERFRGRRLLLGNFEYRHPINETFQVVGFVDVGGAFGGEFPTTVPGFTIRADDDSFEPHVGVGAGIRFASPVGPLRLDFGWSDEGSQAYIGLGQTF